MEKLIMCIYTSIKNYCRFKSLFNYKVTPFWLQILCGWTLVILISAKYTQLQNQYNIQGQLIFIQTDKYISNKILSERLLKLLLLCLQTNQIWLKLKPSERLSSILSLHSRHTFLSIKVNNSTWIFDKCLRNSVCFPGKREKHTF